MATLRLYLLWSTMLSDDMVNSYQSTYAASTINFKLCPVVNAVTPLYRVS